MLWFQMRSRSHVVYQLCSLPIYLHALGLDDSKISLACQRFWILVRLRSAASGFPDLFLGTAYQLFKVPLGVPRILHLGAFLTVKMRLLRGYLWCCAANA